MNVFRFSCSKSSTKAAVVTEVLQAHWRLESSSIILKVMDNDFDSISWRNEPEDESSRPNTAGPSDNANRDFSSSNGKRRITTPPPQAGRNADAVDLAGIGDGRLDCTVGDPHKENHGTKDAYVSYLVTTRVRLYHP